ncbi:MAG: L-lactate permease [Gemmataceae bacterium]|nr:L-lactate permease [Gemmataceae bacterium]
MVWALYVQNLDPLGHRVLSTIVAGMPVLVLFYLLVARRWLAPWAGAAGAITAIVLAWLAYAMPLEMACWAFVHGMSFGLLPIGWTVFAAMLLYNTTLVSGQFTIIRRSIGNLSDDARVQAVLIGFCFGAFMEGAAGAGSPVAICGAMLVGLGVPPFQAAVLCLIANTSPVCFGGLGVPILTLASVTGLSGDSISIMCGHQLPILSCLIPLYMVKTMCSWRETLAIWPALVVGGGSFALAQFFFATAHVYGLPPIWPLTDICGALISMVCLAAFLKFVWKPPHPWRFPATAVGAGQTVEPVRPADPRVAEAEEQVSELLPAGEGLTSREKPLTRRMVLRAWTPWVVMAALLILSGIVRQMEKNGPLDLGFAPSYWEAPVPTLHKKVERAERLVPAGAVGDERKEAALFKVNWLTAPGTSVFFAAIISMLFLRLSTTEIVSVFRKTLYQMRIPIPTIACMLGLSYVTKYAGMDATLGVAFAETGVLYPFFAALLGWLGVFLTGTDAGSNALFGSLQKITATEVWNAHGSSALRHLSLEQTQILICTANSTGGVMGKMIDAQSICVATAGTNQIGREADIFKAVIWHSVFLACVVGLMTVLQAFLWPFTLMVPH